MLSRNQKFSQAIKPNAIVVSCSCRTFTVKIYPVYEVRAKSDIELVGVFDGIGLLRDELSEDADS